MSQFSLPTTIMWGLEEKEHFVSSCVNQRIVVICSKTRHRLHNPIIADILHSIERVAASVTISSHVESNPSYEAVIETIQDLNNCACELIIAIGGGSVIDCAKASAYGAKHPDLDLWELFLRVCGGPQGALPVNVINTTSGTGTEINCCAVVTRQSEKRAIVNDSIFPAKTWIIPELALSMSYAQTVPIFMDCLFHAIEGFLSKNSTEFGRQSALSCLKLCQGYTQSLHFCYKTLKFREDVALASIYSSLADMYGGCLSIHSLGHAISGLKPDVSHGMSIMAVSEAYYSLLHERGGAFADKETALLKALCIEDYESLAEFLSSFYQSSDITVVSLSQMGFASDELETIYLTARECVGELFDNDPMSLTDNDFSLILANSYN